MQGEAVYKADISQQTRPNIKIKKILKKKKLNKTSLKILNMKKNSKKERQKIWDTKNKSFRGVASTASSQGAGPSSRMFCVGMRVSGIDNWGDGA